MTLLRLSPDSERLRRIAKAHAAGELSTPDYRRIRAEVIERFSSGEVAGVTTTTPNRAGSNAPRRRRRDKPHPVASGSRQIARATTRSWWWALVVSVIVIAAVGSAAAWSSTIPPVKQRDPNPATSPRIPVDHLGRAQFRRVSRTLASPQSRSMRCSTAALKDLDEASRPGPEWIHAAELEEIGMLLKSMGVQPGPDADRRAMRRS